MTTPRLVPGRYPTGDRSWRPPEVEDRFRRDWASAGFGYQSVGIDEMMQSGALGILPQLLTPAKRTTPDEGSRSDRVVETVARIDSLEQDVVALKRDLQTSRNLNDQLLDAVERLTTILSAATVPRATGELHREFRALAVQWREETFGQSLAAPGILHPAYLRIIGMGEQAIPWILEELEERGGQWYVALQSITGEDPVAKEDRGQRPRMRAAWQEWGRTNGWID